MTSFITIYLSFLVWPAITILLKEIRKENGNDTLIVGANIFLAIYWYSFLVTVFQYGSYVCDMLIRYN